MELAQESRCVKCHSWHSVEGHCPAHCYEILLGLRDEIWKQMKKEHELRINMKRRYTRGFCALEKAFYRATHLLISL